MSDTPNNQAIADGSWRRPLEHEVMVLRQQLQLLREFMAKVQGGDWKVRR